MKAALALAAATLAIVTPAGAKVFSQLVVFGDSLADTGNAHYGALGLGLPDPTPAAVGYYNGRFSNGENHIDYLNRALVGGPSKPFLLGGTNYAVGGARAVTNADASPDLRAQVGYFSSTPGAVPLDPNALYFVGFGSNDVRAQMEGTADAPSTADAINAILNLVFGLYTGGAHHVFLTNVGDLGTEPVFAGQAAAARTASVAFDAALAAGLGLIGAPSTTGTYTLAPGLTFSFFDTLAFGDALKANPSHFYLHSSLDFTTPCFAVPSALPSCTDYAWADTIHPASGVQRALGQAELRALGVPEPAALALLGMGVLGLVRARRRG